MRVSRFNQPTNQPTNTHTHTHIHLPPTATSFSTLVHHSIKLILPPERAYAHNPSNAQLKTPQLRFQVHYHSGHGSPKVESTSTLEPLTIASLSIPIFFKFPFGKEREFECPANDDVPYIIIPFGRVSFLSLSIALHHSSALPLLLHHLFLETMNARRWATLLG